MKIKVETNKNVIFFETILTQAETSLQKTFDKNPKDRSINPKQLHQLGKEILDKFAELYAIEAYKRFETKYISQEIPTIRAKYLLFAINTSPSLKPLAISSKDGYGPRTSKYYRNELFPILKEIHEESHFDKIYREEIEIKYQALANEVATTFDRYDVAEVLDKFWGSNLSPELIFIPDPLRVAGGSGVARKNKFYSITGGARSDGSVDFKTEQIISNSLHEFSHSYFKELLYTNKIIWEENEMLCQDLSEQIATKSGGEASSNYGSSVTYFEETFIRAVQVFLFDKVLSQSDVSSNWLKNLVDQGFIYIEVFYDELTGSHFGDDPIAVYFRVLRSIVNDSV